jgi:hypothetical protein
MKPMHIRYVAILLVLVTHGSLLLMLPRVVWSYEIPHLAGHTLLALVVLWGPTMFSAVPACTSSTLSLPEPPAPT